MLDSTFLTRWFGLPEAGRTLATGVIGSKGEEVFAAQTGSRTGTEIALLAWGMAISSDQHKSTDPPEGHILALIGHPSFEIYIDLVGIRVPNLIFNRVTLVQDSLWA